MRTDRPMPRLSRRRAALLSLTACTLAVATGCHGGSGSAPSTAVPAPGSAEYATAVSAFYAGALGIESGGDTPESLGPARENLTKASALAPGEPAVWADLALVRAESSDLPGAATALQRAIGSGKDDADLEVLAGELLGTARLNRPAESIAHLKRAIELAPGDVRPRYALLHEQETSGSGAQPADTLAQWQKIAALAPHNVAALLGEAAAAAESGDAATVRQVVQALTPDAQQWTGDASAQYAILRKASQRADAHAMVAPVAWLTNVLKQQPQYQDAMDVLDERAAEGRPAPLQRFLVMVNPSPTPAAPDTGLTFAAHPLPALPAGRWAMIRSLRLVPALSQAEGTEFRLPPTPARPPVTLLANGAQVALVSSDGKVSSLPFPGGPSAAPPTPDGVLSLDFNYDFRPDFAFAGAGGVRLWRQERNGGFNDVTGASKLPASVTEGSYRGAWAGDVDEDGDLDIVIAPTNAPIFVLRNNADGTWTPIHPFPSAPVATGFVWGDLNHDGVADAAALDAHGGLRVYQNLRAGKFQAWPAPDTGGKLLAIAEADLDGDGTMALVAWRADGAILRIGRNHDDTRWDVAQVASGLAPAADGSARILTPDLDNNGGFDLVATDRNGTRVWLCDAQRQMVALDSPLAAARVSAAPPDSGRVDLVGFGKDGAPVHLANTGAKQYNWWDVEPRARYQAVAAGPHGPGGTGDKRINSFGVGGDMELRAGLLDAKQIIDGPTLHYGLGDYKQADSVRIVWPNGNISVRSEFAKPADEIFEAVQRPGGSCPWLFTWNGHEMKLVTDCIWRSPLGLRINAQATAPVGQIQDWVKIRGDQLVPHDGYYDVRITAELNETHYFDYLALMPVDHPANTDVWVDERFAVPQPPLAVIPTSLVVPVAHAVDDRGADVTDAVRARDGRYLDTFGRGEYQGITRDHFVEVTLAPSAPKSGPLYLIATGWLHPTDSSINVAISQGHHDQPRGLSIEAPDGRGGWRTVRSGLGFPDGKIKTVVLDITGLIPPGAPRRLRLRTNLEIYWDFIGTAASRPDAPLHMQRLLPEYADLHLRGFSAQHRADSSSPDMPDYNDLAGTAPRWIDLEGYYTRYGDVRPLLARIDDRYVIMNAGDELAMRFPVPPPPPPGWKRDFVLIGDGWEKDGNFNTTFSRTVLPLPDHRMTTYDRAPTTLEADPVFRRHRSDWLTYQTRYVTARPFFDALKPPPMSPAAAAAR